MTNDQTVTQALEPCPFCGQAPTIEPWHRGAPIKVMVACPGLYPDDDIAPCEVAPQVTGETPAEAIAAWNTRTAQSGEGRDFQSEVGEWMLACFGDEIAADKIERADRFIEEALELAQTIPGFTVERARALVEYVFGRPVGERGQEVGGVGVTLAALCNTYDLNIAAEWERELARVWTKVEAIRAKQATKPVGSALPVAVSGEGRSNGAGEDGYLKIPTEAMPRGPRRDAVVAAAMKLAPYSADPAGTPTRDGLVFLNAAINEAAAAHFAALAQPEAGGE